MNSFSASCCRFGYEPITGPYSLVYARSTCVISEQRQVCWAKALLHKPVPPLAKTRWYLRLTVFALESHYQQVCSTQTGVLPEQCCCWFSCLLTSEWHSVNMSIFKSSSGEERQICECLEWRGGRVDHPDQLRDGSNAVAAASPAPPGPKTDGYCSYCSY